MKTLKKITAVLVAVLMTLSLAACGDNEDSDEVITDAPEINYEREVKTKIAALNGPTGLGLAEMKADRSFAYDIEFYSDPQEVAPLLIKGEVDIAALPLNLAANLYKKTNGQVRMLAINTLGVLHVLSKDESIKSISDLKGKTVLATGQGSTPEYIINYILEQNGLEPGKDVTIEYKSAHNELATLAIEGTVDLCILPEPFASKVLSKNEDMKRVMDLTDEWEKVSTAKLAQGCVVARADFVENNPELVTEFLSYYEASVNFTTNSNKAGIAFLYNNGYFESSELAEMTVPNCNIVFITGEEMKQIASENFAVLYEADPASVGGEIPADDLYYLG